MKIITLKKLAFFQDKDIHSLVKLKNQGYCNINYKIQTAQSQYLLREFKDNDTIDINRSFEFKAQKLASLKKVAPKPLLLDTNHTFMITEFINGQHRTKLKNIELINLIKKVKKFHLTNIKTKEHSLQNDFICYAQILKDNDSKILIKQAFKELGKLKAFKKDLVLVHHDLNPKNILFTKNDIKIIDWEYAQTNDLFFDLASLSYEFNLSKKEDQLILKTYFKNITLNQINKLNSYKIIYKNLCLLWFKSLKIKIK